ncbi:MAG: hypothetical protein ACXACC_04250 [Promethearchaeota archaeon]|jgi:hypothetical protein
MKKKILILPLLALLLFIWVPSVQGYEYSDNINEGISVYYLTALDVGESIEVNVTHLGDGNFTIFLFDERPLESYVNFDKTLNKEIFNIAINYSLDENPYLFYNASESKIYYFQLILLDTGPDTFFIYSDKELARYYLPIIPGFHLFLLILLIPLISGLLALKNMKKIQKK